MSATVAGDHRRGSPYPSVSHGLSPASAHPSYGVHYISQQFHDSPTASSSLSDAQWRQRTLPNMGLGSGYSHTGNPNATSAPTSATSTYPRGAPWAPTVSPSIPAPILERSDQSGSDLTFVPYDPSNQGSHVSGDPPGYVSPGSQGSATFAQERMRQRAGPSGARATSASIVDKPPPSPTEANDPVPRRGRRPVRKSASEQQLHDQQRQHQHQLQLTHVQPQRTRVRRQASGTVNESGPIRGVAREEYSRRKSSSALSASKGEVGSPLQGAGYLMVKLYFHRLHISAPALRTEQDSTINSSFIRPLSRNPANHKPPRTPTRPKAPYQRHHPPRHYLKRGAPIIRTLASRLSRFLRPHNCTLP